MKRFIILTSTIRNMGGAQMYAANKLAYYESLGWKPDIFFFNQGPVRIKYLKQFEGGWIADLSKPLCDCNKAKRAQIRKKIIGENIDDDILFECHMPHLAFWGEYLSSISHGKNTVFLLEEILPKFTKGEYDFFAYKLKRKELLNNSEKNIKRLFKDRKIEHIYGNNNSKIIPYCDNVVDYTPINLPNGIDRADFSIISIGRLDKPYIKPMLDEILYYTQKHKDSIFNLIMAGGDAHNQMSNYVRELFRRADNVQLFLLGYIFPIPYDWIKLSDVSIASSNSILVSANEGIPTIGIDIHDFQPIGLYGVTTNNLWERDSEPIVSISKWLDDVLITRKYKKHLVEHNTTEDLAKYLKPHLDLLIDSDQSKEYFDVLNMYSFLEKMKAKIVKIYLKLKR